jgi:hypothetical protein
MAWRTAEKADIGSIARFGDEYDDEWVVGRLTGILCVPVRDIDGEEIYYADVYLSNVRGLGFDRCEVEFTKAEAMCDLDSEVLVDDAVGFIFSQLDAKHEECITAATGPEDYDRLFKHWLKEVVTDLVNKCEDLAYYREGGTEGLDAVVVDDAQQLNCHRMQAIFDRKMQQHKRTTGLAKRLFVALVGGPTWSRHDTPSDTARAAWILAEAMIDFANEQKPEE